MVETFMAALSMELMANVENLTYRGVDADQFVGTGNAGNNVITGGDLERYAERPRRQRRAGGRTRLGACGFLGWGPTP